MKLKIIPRRRINSICDTIERNWEHDENTFAYEVKKYAPQLLKSIARAQRDYDLKQLEKINER